MEAENTNVFQSGGPFTEADKLYAAFKEVEDPVNHPYHYTKGQYECIKVMEDVFGPEAVAYFCLCNAFKYIWRTNEKNGLEDIEKAKWYLTKYHELKEKTDAGI